jgi:hypothetical protein
MQMTKSGLPPERRIGNALAMQIDLKIVGTAVLCCLPIAAAQAIIFRQRQRE